MTNQPDVFGTARDPFEGCPIDVTPARLLGVGLSPLGLVLAIAGENPENRFVLVSGARWLTPKDD